ncbi:ArsR/SmtB family transcription factor, partial [Gordonia aichiensis]
MVQYDFLDASFGALADPTRRGILERLGRGPASISELAEAACKDAYTRLADGVRASTAHLQPLVWLLPPR